MPVVELPPQNVVPGVLAGTRRARQAENVGALGDAGAGARLNRRGRHLGERDHVKHRREAVDLLLEQRLQGLRRHVAPGKAGAAGGDDDIDGRVGDPGLHLGPDLRHVVLDDCPPGQLVARGSDHLGERGAGFVIAGPARIRHRQHGDAHRNEGAGLVDFGHWRSSLLGPRHCLRTGGDRHVAPRPASPAAELALRADRLGTDTGSTGTHSSVRRCTSRVNVGSLR